MAASTAGALKVVIEAAGLGLQAYRDEAPKLASLPYCVIHESITNVPDPDEDGGPDTTAELAQIDLFQMWRNASRAIVETYSLPDALLLVLAAARNINLSAPKHVYGVVVSDVQRLLEADQEILDPADGATLLGFGLVHHSFTVRLRRKLA